MDVAYCAGIFSSDRVDPGSCSLKCSRILRILDLAFCFVVGSFGSWVLHPGYVMGS